MTDEDESPDRDEPADHSEDPRKAGVGSGGYPEESPAGGSDRHPGSDSDDEDGSRREADGDPGQATGNPRAAGADPQRRR